jgi:uncharacterized protein (TIGR02453 family)
MAPKAYFDTSLFDFLEELRANNHREWFLANKGRYESEVRDPIRRFIIDFAPRLQGISSRLIADPRANGGSMFRINRDVRFSKDKSPYKTNAGVQFRHQAWRDAHAPCFYLHLEPGLVFVAAGVWHPASTALGMIRDHIVEHPKKWQRAISSKTFRTVANLGGEMLKRPPNGYDATHPLIGDLKRKDFIARAPLTQEQVCVPAFMDEFTDTCRALSPLTKFLSEALQLPW